MKKSRHIRSSQVRLQREKSKPPQNKNAVEGGGGREGHLTSLGGKIRKNKKKYIRYWACTYEKLCPCHAN